MAVTALGPHGQGDDPGHVRLAIDGSSGTAWHTDWYTTAHFGNLYSGTGLLVDMGRPVTITAAHGVTRTVVVRSNVYAATIFAPKTIALMLPGHRATSYPAP